MRVYEFGHLSGAICENGNLNTEIDSGLKKMPTAYKILRNISRRKWIRLRVLI